MSHNRDLSAAAAQLGFHSSNIGIGSEAPRYALDVYNSNLLVSGPSAGNIILEDRGVGDSSRPFHVVSSDGGKFVINRSNRNASGTTTSSVNSLTLNSSGNLGLGPQTNPTANIHIADLSANGYELKITGNALQFNRSSNSYIDQLHDTGSILFRMTSSNTEAMRITSAGRIGVNATNPDRRLEVVETAGSLTFPVAVSNHTDASAGVGAGIAFHLTAGGNARGDFGVVYAGNSNSDGTDFVFRPNDGSTGQVERLRIKGSSGRVGINETSPTARLDINHPNTEQGLVVRSRYGNISTAMVKFDADPDSNGGDGNVVHIHGGSSRTDSEILHVNSTGEGTCFQIRGDGRTRVYKQLQLEHASNVPKIIFNEYGANDIKAQIEMDQVSGSSGQLIFRTQNSGTLSERMRITNAGYVLKSDTPAFQCKLSSATGSQFNGYLTFTSVRYNIGNHYNSSNGRFTAPVDGRYLFSWYTNMSRYGGNGSLWADWYVNGGAQGNRMYTHHSGAWELIGGTIIMDLNSSDYVQIYTGQPGSWDGGSYGAFSGYLLG